jgi:DNA helicase-2/ATP-dependent DNA helicase PcrA
VWADPPADGTANPVTAEPVRADWPYDPLARRRASVEAGAAAVRAAAYATEGTLFAVDPATPTPVADRWARDVELLLDERARRARPDEVVVPLPARLSVSQLVTLGRDPDALARAVRRPLPAAPDPLARRGTAFHAWLEGRWGAPRLVDEHELPGAADEHAAGSGSAAALAALQAAFLASRWALRTPVEVEAPFELLVDGVLLRGRADAVFADSGEDGEPGLEVVDWKTGPPPRDPADLAARAVQLAAYRLAWARLRGLPLERVRAAFHHVREGLTIAPVDLLDEAGLVDLVRRVPAA